MSALANGRWESRSNATLAEMPYPEESKGMGLRDRMRIVRDTVLVLGLQIVFRATMALRRWNY